eukprot:TRINITY_DN1218_c0_g2_i1.p1 TRINITY_DN1218_c0_g2~~TRINITY_DN1218_c0_g2_i1.p1  ORF type:complete len:285 (-),score=51.58 TRINITY_DN1218_c0_g2_i1:17-871(-)
MTIKLKGKGKVNVIKFVKDEMCQLAVLKGTKVSISTGLPASSYPQLGPPPEKAAEAFTQDAVSYKQQLLEQREAAGQVPRGRGGRGAGTTIGNSVPTTQQPPNVQQRISASTGTMNTRTTTGGTGAQAPGRGGGPLRNNSPGTQQPAGRGTPAPTISAASSTARPIGGVTAVPNTETAGRGRGRGRGAPVGSGGLQQQGGAHHVGQQRQATPSSVATPRKRYVKALYAFTPEQAHEIELQEGDIVELLDNSNNDWWTGVRNGKTGIFPAVYVEMATQISAGRSQ